MPRLGQVAEHRVVLGLHARACRSGSSPSPRRGCRGGPAPASTSATAPSAPRFGSSASPANRSGAYATYSASQSLYACTSARWKSAIGVGEHRLAEPGRGIEHLGVDAVLVHLVEARRRVVAAAADLVEALPARHLLGRQARARVHPEVDRVGRRRRAPTRRPARTTRCAARGPGTARDPRRPQVAGLVHVTVGRDQPVAGTLTIRHDRRSYSRRRQRSTESVRMCGALD